MRYPRLLEQHRKARRKVEAENEELRFELERTAVRNRELEAILDRAAVMLSERGMKLTRSEILPIGRQA